MHKGICLVNLQHPEDKTNDLKIGDPIAVADRTQFEWLIAIESIRSLTDGDTTPPTKSAKKPSRNLAE